MKHLFGLILGIMLVVGSYSCKESETVRLFNGNDLDNWIMYIADSAADPGDVFYVEDGLLNVKGIPNGYIRTKESYSDYLLHVEWRWVEEPKNSGVLLHIQGEDRLWPLCIEAQLMHGNAGDLVLISEGSGITVNDTTHLIGEGEGQFETISKFRESSEKPAGKWNVYEIKCSGDLIELKVNGILQNRGHDATLRKGKIGIQSEGGPMEFRNIFLEKIPAQ